MTYCKMVRNEALETVHNGSSIEEVSANVIWCDIGSGAIEWYTMPLYELVFSAVEIVILREFVR